MPHPDVLGYGLKDYGNRVGLWRMFDVMDHFNVRCTTSLNLSVYEHYPEIMEACESRGWDTLCHGIYNTQYLWGLDEGDERAIIQECVETYRRLTGRQLPGWFSPAASHTLNTPDLVAEAGIKYYADWFHDDQPMPMNVRQGRLLTVPYSMELNDAVMHNRAQEADDFEVMVRDYFDTIYAEGAAQPRIMCLALHPYMMGQPHRIGYLEKALDYILSHSGVWQATGEQIADWYYAEMWDQMSAHLHTGGDDER